LGESTLPWTTLVSTRIACLAKSTSRQRSATISPRRRPAKAAVRKIAASCSLAAARTSRPDLLGRVEVEARRVVVDLDLGHGRHRVALQPVQHRRPLVHRVQEGDQLRGLATLARADQELGLPALDARRRHLLDAQVPERRHEVAPDA
jgi:hypothetical protein